MRRIQGIAAALALALVAAPAAPQAVVTALARDLEPLTETTDVRCTRFASFADEPSVKVTMELEPGDLLASVSGDVDLELKCPNGSLLRFTGGFRVMVDTAEEGTDCAVNFLSGTVDVLTDQPTEVNAGGVVLGSEGTQYSVELTRGAKGADWNCWVYDGRVRWKTRETKNRWLETGKRLLYAPHRPGGAVMEKRIAEPDRSRTAWRYAKFDVIKSRASGRQLADPQAAVRELSQLHLKVLARPTDTDLRVALAKKQLDYQIPSQATYNLNRAGIRTEQEMRRHQIDSTRIMVAPPQLDVPPSRGLVTANDPMALFQAGRHQDAVVRAKEKRQAGTADSRDYCAMALAYRQLGDVESTVGAAKRAVYYHERDGKLSDRELAACRRLAEGS